MSCWSSRRLLFISFPSQCCTHAANMFVPCTVCQKPNKMTMPHYEKQELGKSRRGLFWTPRSKQSTSWFYIQMQCHDLDSLLSAKCSSISGRTFVLNFLGFWLTFKIVHSESVGAFNNWKGSPLGGSSLLHFSQKSKSQSSLLALTLYILMYPLRCKEYWMLKGSSYDPWRLSSVALIS